MSPKDYGLYPINGGFQTFVEVFQSTLVLFNDIVLFAKYNLFLLILNLSFFLLNSMYFSNIHALYFFAPKFQYKSE